MSWFYTLAAEGPNGRFIPSDIKEFWYGAAAFLIVLALLIWKLGPVIDKALRGQGEKVGAELASAEEAQAEANAEVEALMANLGDAESDGQALVAQAKAQAEQLKVDAAAKAEADAVAIRERAAADVEGMRAQTTADIEAEVSAKALEVAEEVAVSNLDDATQSALIESYIQTVGGAR